MTDTNSHYDRPPYVIGRLDAADERAPELRLEAFPVEYAAGFGAQFAALTPWAEYGFAADSLAAYFAAQEAGAPRMLIALDDEPAGVAGFRCQWLRGPHLRFLGVLPPFQGRGIGGAVLTWWERQALGAGDRNLWATVSAFNEGARAFYAGHGFIETAQLPGLIDDERCEILLRKRV